MTIPRLHRTSVGSTNVEAFALLESGETPPFWLVADQQTEGRGRSGRLWTSPVGNLYASLAFRTERPMQECPTLAFVSALAVSDAVIAALGSAASADVRVKWPNDVLVQGAKISGILLESRTIESVGQCAVIGCGINVASAPDGLDRAAASLRTLGCDIGAGQVLDHLDKAFQHWLALWNAGGFDAIRVPWLARAVGVGQTLDIRTPVASFRADFEDLDHDGALLARLPDGTLRKVAAGDVFPVATPSSA